MTTSTPTHAASNTTAAPMSGASTGAAGHGTPLATFTALLRREFWENRGGLWTSQLWTTGILLVLIALSLLIGETFRVNLVGDVDVASLADLAGSQVQGTQLAELRRGLGIGLWSLGVLNQIVLYFVVLFYCISALYDERKDRSILFWKSLPATDTQTVLSKLVTAVLVALAEAGVSVDMIAEATEPGGGTQLQVTVAEAQRTDAESVVRQVLGDLGGGAVEGSGGLSRIAMVGSGMHKRPGVYARAFRTLLEHEVEVCAVSTSGISITLWVPDDREEAAVAALHEAFSLELAGAR